MPVVGGKKFFTCFELYSKFGIQRQKTCRYIRSGKLNAYMFPCPDNSGYILLKWYIVDDEALRDFIEKNKVKD